MFSGRKLQSFNFLLPPAPEPSIAAQPPSSLMPLSRHAYRHAIQPSTSSIFDHVWISDDALTSTFRRYANRQRRHGSNVPGPLEARRRLAKRKNGALAGVGGPGGLDDIACLFGKEGQSHLKWTSTPNYQGDTQGELLIEQVN